MTDRDDDTALGQLVDVLEVARSLVRDLTEDPLLARWMSVYRAMPDEDRETIITVLERETLGRHLSRGTEKAVGSSTHVNPNARLYIRSHETEFDHRHFDFEQMRVANVRAMRVATIIRYVPGIYALFKEAVRAAMDEVDEPTREVSERLLRDVLAAIAEAREAAPPEAAPEPGPEPENEAPSSGTRRRGS
jgi:hypothetical protein